MGHNQRCALLCAALALTSAACLGEPLPKRVVAGTSFTLLFNFGVFGTSSPTPLLSSDPQRGNVRFALCPLSGECTPQNEKPLIVRYVSRVFPDRASKLGITGETLLPGSPPGKSSILGEPVVILDVPVLTQPAMYQLTTFIDRPVGMDVMQPLQSIEIVAGNVEAFTNLARIISGFGDLDGTESLKGFVPYPQIPMTLTDPNNDLPASGSVLVRYPSSVKIETAFEFGNLGQGSMVRMFPNPAQANTMFFTFVDQDQRLTGLSLAFTLTNPSGPPADPNGFVIVSQELFRPDGTLLPLTNDPAAAGNQFNLGQIQ